MRIVALLTAASLACACSRTEPPPPPTDVAARTLEIGVHRVEVRLPKHWDVASRDETFTLRAPFAADAEPTEVLLVDFVPATIAGMRDEVRAARELWRAGRVDVAKKRLLALPIGSALLPSMAAPSAYARAWSRLLYAPGDASIEAADPLFATLIAGLEASSPFDLAAVVDWAMPLFDGSRLTSISYTSGGTYEGEAIDHLAGRHDARRRDVVSRTTRTVNGREAIEVETRENLTRTRPRRMTFVLHGNRVLLIAATPAAEGQSFAAYEGVRDSLVFRD